MRVRLGLFLSFRMTAALSSKRMYEPSGRPYSLAWRTITALTTSPFLTDPPGVATFTDATITSPIDASNFEPPATTRMHISSRAPVLSATRRRVWGMITTCSRVAGSRLHLSDLDRLAGPAAQDVPDDPVLVLADRPRLGNHHRVADLTAVSLVVGFEAAGAAQGSPVPAVAADGLDGHHDRLLPLAAYGQSDLGEGRPAGVLL